MMEISPKQLSPKIYSLKGWVKLIEPDALKFVFDAALNKAEFKVLNYNEHHFPLNGFTGFWLLAESHLALHSFAESGWCYIELSSCNEEKTKVFLNYCNRLKHEMKWEKTIEEYSQ
ncbi:MAG: S-adenosylmethionine decarboxylase [Carboxylicivirga sp.]|jgi:S-adenosylmethionine decarboxylase|nr:S-adenosylmethionine decarboxylase [Carboxylicivirga sp.]